MDRARPGRAASRRGGALLGALLLSACAPGEAPAPRSDDDPGAGAEASATPSAADGQGAARVVPSGPVPCGSRGSWSIEWAAGPAGVAEGGGVVLQVSPFWGWTPPQTTRPGQPGYTTLRSSGAARLRLAEGAVPMTVVARVEQGALSPGDTVRFVYGDSAIGGPGSLARTDVYAEDIEEFLIKVDGDGDGVFGAIRESPALRILAGPPALLAVAAPAVVEPGEEFDVQVHALDDRDNRTDLPAGPLEIRLRDLEGSGRTPLVVAAGPEGSHESDGRRLRARIEREGLYRIEAVWTSGGESAAPDVLSGANDLILVEEGSRFGAILWGDLHAHSALSDGTGTPRALYAYARDVSGLDVCAVTDHDAHGLAPLADGGWEAVRAATREFHEPGRFVTLLGYEWTSWTWGHRNVYYPTDEGAVFEFRAPDSDTPQELWARIAAYGGITIPHHPGGGPVAIDWSVPSDAERERVVEICSVHGSSEAPGVERGIYSPVPGASVREALGPRHRLGILASGDGHDGHPGRRTVGAPANGLAAFRTAQRTREAVLTAIHDRSVYGTSGPRILLATDWDGHRPGVDVANWPAGPITVRVVAPEPVQRVEVVADGGILARGWGGGRRATHVFDQVSPGTSSWVYVRVELGDGETAWESPWWLTPPGEGSS